MDMLINRHTGLVRQPNPRPARKGKTAKFKAANGHQNAIRNRQARQQEVDDRK